ncbi:hypothetical protein EDC01DRAFT_674832 [Geopyxis carbonaria]|nr:hypothetical protein EDC01DRAFT_674832 [Geopyxis carbonaria]
MYSNFSPITPPPPASPDAASPKPTHKVLKPLGEAKDLHEDASIYIIFPKSPRFPCDWDSWSKLYHVDSRLIIRTPRQIITAIFANTRGLPEALDFIKLTRAKKAGRIAIWGRFQREYKPGQRAEQQAFIDRRAELGYPFEYEIWDGASFYQFRKMYDEVYGEGRTSGLLLRVGVSSDFLDRGVDMEENLPGTRLWVPSGASMQYHEPIPKFYRR